MACKLGDRLHRRNEFIYISHLITFDIYLESRYTLDTMAARLDWPLQSNMGIDEAILKLTDTSMFSTNIMLLHHPTYRHCVDYVNITEKMNRPISSHKICSRPRQTDEDPRSN